MKTGWVKVNEVTHLFPVDTTVKLEGLNGFAELVYVIDGTTHTFEVTHEFLAAIGAPGPWSVGPVVPSLGDAQKIEIKVDEPELVECGVEEAVTVVMDMVHGRFWAENWQDKLERARKAGYVIAKRSST